MLPAVSSRRRLLLACLLASLAAPPSAHAQDQVRGVGVRTAQPAQPATGTWRAVVVGVSRYSALPPLSFADNDAEAIYQFLVRKDGGGLDTANVALFLDREASRPAIIQTLLRMASQSRKGDRLLLYFGGHGDVQRIDDTGEAGYAYLLLANATPGLYDGSNDVLNPVELQQFVEMRMRQKGGEFLVVLDACRSGAVADMKDGAQAAMRHLSQWQGVNKLLSSTGNQLSHESAEWGGGHGVFTYYLLEALNGLADVDRDSTLTFREVQRYVSDSVEQATMRRGLQTPTFFAADERAALFHVDGPRDVALRALRGGATRTLASATRDVSGSAAAVPIADSALASMVAEFRQAIARGRLLEEPGVSPGAAPGTAPGASAWSLHRRIVARLDTRSPVEADLAQRVSGTLAVALQEAAEEPARRFFRGVSDYPSPAEFHRAARALAGARELLGPAHHFADDLRWREQFMSGFAIVREGDFSRFAEAEAKLKDALRRANGAAPLQAALAALYRARRDIPAARRYVNEAIRLAPRWEYAHKLRADLLGDEGKVAEALAAYQEISRRFPNSSAAPNNLGVLYHDLDRYMDARRSYERAWSIRRDPLYLTNLAAVAIDQKRYGEADSLVAAALAMDSTMSLAWFQRGNLLRAKKEGTAALEAFRRVAALDPFDTRSRVAIADLLDATDAALAEREYRAALAIDPDDDGAAGSLAELLRSRGDTAAGEALLVALEARLPGRAAPAYALALFHQNARHLPEAERWHRQALARDSLYYHARVSLAEVLVAAGRDAEAEREFARARDLAVGNPIPAIEFARHLFGRGALDRAAAEYRRALAIDSMLVETQAELAEVLAEQGQVTESVALYRQAMAGNAWAYTPLGVAMRFETRAAAMEYDRRDSAAAPLWAAAHALVPDRVRAILGLARVRYALDDRAAARSILDTLAASLPADDDDVLPVVWHIQSLLTFEDGDGAAALAQLDRANARRDQPDLATRAAMLWSLGRHEQARRALGQAVRPSPVVRLGGRAARAFAEVQRASMPQAPRPAAASGARR